VILSSTEACGSGLAEAYSSDSKCWWRGRSSGRSGRIPRWRHLQSSQASSEFDHFFPSLLDSKPKEDGRGKQKNDPTEQERGQHETDDDCRIMSIAIAGSERDQQKNDALRPPEATGKWVDSRRPVDHSGNPLREVTRSERDHRLSVLLDSPPIALWALEFAARYRASPEFMLGMLADALETDASE
jgi:hypothetical protein